MDKVSGRWKDIVGYALNHQETISLMRQRKEKREIHKKIRKLVPIPIIVGCIAALVMYWMYGGEALLKAFLTWIIGLTIIATIIAYLPKNLAK